jgi:hypothetical protein
MSKILGFVFVSVILLAFVNILFHYYYKPVIQKDNLVGLYINKGNSYTDSLWLEKDQTFRRAFQNKKTGEYKITTGSWGIIVNGYITVDNFSFAESYRGADLSYSYDFFWRVKIAFGISEIYKKQ